MRLIHCRQSDSAEKRFFGINGLTPVEAHTDLAALCREHPDTALIGGIDRRSLEGDAARLERDVRERAGCLWAHGRAIPSADAHYPISDRVSLANMRLYVRLLKEGGTPFSLPFPSGTSLHRPGASH